jgi:integral membrane protein
VEIIVSSEHIDRVRLLGYVEGVSFLLLLGIAMPLKYLAGQPGMVSVVGMLHGVLFLLYVGAVGHIAAVRRWPIRRVLLAWVAAVVPFGPFVLDGHLREDARPAGAAGATGGAVG